MIASSISSFLLSNCAGSSTTRRCKTIPPVSFQVWPDGEYVTSKLSGSFWPRGCSPPPATSSCGFMFLIKYLMLETSWSHCHVRCYKQKLAFNSAKVRQPLLFVNVFSISSLGLFPWFDIYEDRNCIEFFDDNDAGRHKLGEHVQLSFTGLISLVSINQDDLSWMIILLRTVEQDHSAAFCLIQAMLSLYSAAKLYKCHCHRQLMIGTYTNFPYLVKIEDWFRLVESLSVLCSIWPALQPVLSDLVSGSSAES